MRRGQLWRHTYKYSYLQVPRARGDVFYFVYYRAFFVSSRSSSAPAEAPPLSFELSVERALLPFKRDAPNLVSPMPLSETVLSYHEHFFRDFSEFALSLGVQSLRSTTALSGLTSFTLDNRSLAGGSKSWPTRLSFLLVSFQLLSVPLLLPGGWRVGEVDVVRSSSCSADVGGIVLCCTFFVAVWRCVVTYARKTKEICVESTSVHANHTLETNNKQNIIIVVVAFY